MYIRIDEKELKETYPAAEELSLYKGFDGGEYVLAWSAITWTCYGKNYCTNIKLCLLSTLDPFVDVSKNKNPQLYL